MEETGKADRIHDFVGSAYVLVSTITDVVEESLRRQSVGDEITNSQLKVLKLISLADVHTVGDVAAFMRISNAAASKALDKLVRKTLVNRVEADDRRVIHISLTEAGRRLLSRYDAARTKVFEEIFGGFTATELRTAAELLDRLSAHIVETIARPEDMCLQCGLHFHEKCLIKNLLSRRCLYQRQKSREVGAQPDPEGPASVETS